MGAAPLIARSRLRANLGATVLLVVLAGIGGGIVMASIAGMRRAETAWQHFQADNPDGDAAVVFLNEDGQLYSGVDDDLEDEADAVAALPGVTGVTRASAMVGMVEGRDGGAVPVAAAAYLDGLVQDLVGRPIVVEGRLPDAGAADEVAVDELLADRAGVEAGDELTFTTFLSDELESASDGRDTDPGGEPRRMRVVGVVRGPGDLLPPRTSQYALYSDEPYMLLPPAWYEANGPDVGNYGIFMVADLQPEATLEDLSASVADRFGERAFVVSPEDEVGIPAEVRRAVDRQIDSEGQAILVFALAVATVATLLFALAMSRQLAAEGADRGVLRSLGVRRSELVLADVLRSLAVAVGAAVVAGAVAIGLSPWLPIGVGGRAVRDRGLDVDVPVLFVASVFVGILVVGVVLLAGWRQASERRARTTTSVADRFARLGTPPAATIGVHMAFDRSPAAMAGRGAIAVAGLAIAVAVAAAAVLASFDELQRTPYRLGQVWDASAGNFATAEGRDAGLAQLDEMEGIEAVAGELGVVATIGGRDTNGVAYVPIVGELVPNLREGRAPRAVDEIVLGAKLADELDVAVGDRVPVAWETLEDAPEEVTVTGIGAVAGMGFEVDPGDSALVSPEVARLDPDDSVSVLLIRFADDADRDGLLAELRERFPQTVLAAPVPSRSVQTLDGLRVLPVALAVAVALLALAAGANAALASVRRRRRELAVVKVLGLQRAEVRRVVTWQALTWAVVALLVGVPLGVLLGSLGWQAVLRSLGLDSPFTLPAGTVLALVLAAPLLLVGLTWWPARQAAATAPAVTLRSE
ncbi:MAG: FtsX-like permease family protein [Acidimicrobiales bacterium]